MKMDRACFQKRKARFFIPFSQNPGERRLKNQYM